MTRKELKIEIATKLLLARVNLNGQLNEKAYAYQAIELADVIVEKTS